MMLRCLGMDTTSAEAVGIIKIAAQLATVIASDILGAVRSSKMHIPRATAMPERLSPA